MNENLKVLLNSFNDAPESVIYVDLKGRIEYLNKAAAKIVGKSKSSAIGEKFSNIIKFKTRSTGNSVDLIERLLKKKETIDLEKYDIFVGKETKPLLYYGSISPLYQSKGKEMEGMLIVFCDMSEKRDEEEKLKERTKELQLMIDNLPAIVWFKDDRSRFVRVNKRYEEAMGRSKGEIEGHTDFDFYPRHDAEIFREKDVEVMKSGMTKSLYEVKSRGDRGVRYLHTVKVPIKDESGKARGTIGICHDVTDVKKAEEKIQHLSNLLYGIRDINKLIVEEKDAKELTLKACKSIVNIHGYYSSYIALVGSKGHLKNFVSSGIGEEALVFSSYISEGNTPGCWKLAKHKAGVIPIERPRTFCLDCPLCNVCMVHESAVVRLKHKGNLFGYLLVNLDAGLVTDSDVMGMLNEVSEDIGFALHGISLEEKSKSLRKIVDKVVFVDTDLFMEKVRDLDGRTFRASYVVMDVVDSGGHNLDCSRYQRLVSSIAMKYGGIWGMSWGDVMHCVFSDSFLSTPDGHEVSAYLAAVEICNEVKRVHGVSMRVGICTGRLKFDPKNIQLNQTQKSKVVDKAVMAQESRLGISTLQQPSKELRSVLEGKGYSFGSKEDIVRGEIVPLWKLYPKTEVLKEAEGKKESKLSYESSIKVMLTKGVCSHGHLEGLPISAGISEAVRRAGRYFEKDKVAAEKFTNLTGRTPKWVIETLDRVESWGESRNHFDFKKHFLPWLYIAKLGEVSTPQIVYELTKAQLEYDLKVHAGFTREFNSTVWIEMGVSHSKSIDAFVNALEDCIYDYPLLGPVGVGVSVKRFYLESKVSKSINPNIAKISHPYLKALELLSAIKQSKVSEKVNLFASVCDIAAVNPLFGWKKNPRRATHTRNFYKAISELEAHAQVHLLEELADLSVLGKNKDRLKELPFVLELFDELNIKNARFIHMAYWPEELPYLKEIIEGGHEIVTCPTSTKCLGPRRKPRSPMLLGNKAFIEGMIYEDSFPRVLIGTDDGGPFGIRDVWEEIIVAHDYIAKKHDKNFADLALTRFLRNQYDGMAPDEVSSRYGLDVNAVEWVFGYDLYTNPSELRNEDVAKAVCTRAEKILKERSGIVKKIRD